MASLGFSVCMLGTYVSGALYLGGVFTFGITGMRCVVTPV